MNSDKKSDDMKTVNLNFSFTLDAEEYSSLSMRRSKVKDRLAIANMKNMTDEEKEVRFFANLCNVAPNVIEELDESDYKQLSEAYMAFFTQEGLKTSEKRLSSSHE